MKKITIFIGLALLLVLSAIPVYAQGIPPLPHAFYGSVTIDGSPAPVGTEVEARGTGVSTGIADNPTITTVSGVYGTSNPFEHRLIVQGDIDDGATLTFYVNGVSTGQTAEWHSGETTELGLSVTIRAPTDDRDGEPTRLRLRYIETTLFGIEGRFLIDSAGKILETIQFTSADGNLTITIPKGTIALDKHGNPLSTLWAVIEPNPPPPPSHIIGLAYDFGPEGATFDPPITFTWSYDPDALPEGVVEEDLYIAHYDEDIGEWVECTCTCDPGTHCVTAAVSHFTCFATIGEVKLAAFTISSLVISPAEVAPGEKVSISISLANTGGLEGSYSVVLKINGVKEAEQRATIAAGASKTVTFVVAKEEAGSYSVTVDGMSGSFVVVTPVIAPPPPPPVIIAPPAPPPPPVPLPAPLPPAPPPPAPPNWPLIAGIIAGAVVVGLLIYFLVVRRRAY